MNISIIRKRNSFLRKNGRQTQVGIEISFANAAMQHALEMFNYFFLGWELWGLIKCFWWMFPMCLTKFPSSSQCVPKYFPNSTTHYLIKFTPLTIDTCGPKGNISKIANFYLGECMKFEFFCDGLIKMAYCLFKKRIKTWGCTPQLTNITNNDR
jgi:hypothetical protein